MEVQLAENSRNLSSLVMSCRKRAKASDWDTAEATPAVARWDATPGPASDATPGRWDATPGVAGGSRWDATPGRDPLEPTPRKNRWDETPTPGRVRIFVHLCMSNTSPRVKLASSYVETRIVTCIEKCSNDDVAQ